MNKMNKKGFTIVELVIVIAVIAILAGVLIPTFSGIVDKANESKALQEATNAYKEAYAKALTDDGVFDAAGETETVGATGAQFTFTFSATGDVTSVKAKTNFGYKVTVSGGKVAVAECTHAAGDVNADKLCVCGVTVD